MLTINIHNDGSGTEDSSNYDFSVLVNGKEIDRGRVTGHNRADDWRTLVIRLLRQDMGYYEYLLLTSQFSDPMITWGKE